MFDATIRPSLPFSRRAFFRAAAEAAVLALLVSQPESPVLAEAGAGLLRGTFGLSPPHLLGALELATHVPALFEFSPSQFVLDRNQTYALVSFGNSNGLDTWQGIRHHSTAQGFADRMNQAGHGHWRVLKNYAHAGATELEVDAQVTSRRAIRGLQGVQHLCVFVDPCGDDFKHDLATPAQVSSLRRFLYTINPSGLARPRETGGSASQGLLADLEAKRRALSYLGREAAYILGSVARDIAAIGATTYRLLDDIRRLYDPEYIVWINAANYGYARFFSLGEQTEKHFPINDPIERIFARNVATAVNNQEYLGITKFLSRGQRNGTAVVYIDAYHHITPAQLGDGPHYNDAGVDLLAGLAAEQFV